MVWPGESEVIYQWTNVCCDSIQEQSINPLNNKCLIDELTFFFNPANLQNNWWQQKKVNS